MRELRSTIQATSSKRWYAEAETRGRRGLLGLDMLWFDCILAGDGAGGMGEAAEPTA